jgi:hypothetical protein
MIGFIFCSSLLFVLIIVAIVLYLVSERDYKKDREQNNEQKG